MLLGGTGAATCFTPGAGRGPRDKFAEGTSDPPRSLTGVRPSTRRESALEPALGHSGSVWYRLRAPAKGDVSLNTGATRADITLGAYTGSSVKSLNAIVHDDDAGSRVRGGCFGSHVRSPAQAGTTYRISVAAFSGASGRVQIVARSIATPANDAFASARGLRVGKRAIQSTAEPRHAGRPAAKSLWSSFRAPRTGRFLLTTEASSFDTPAAVYRGTASRTSTRSPPTTTRTGARCRAGSPSGPQRLSPTASRSTAPRARTREPRGMGW